MSRRAHWRVYESSQAATISTGSCASRPSTRSAASTLLLQDLALALVRQDLPLDPLQRVVDRLRVAVERLGHVLVGAPLEIETQRVRLERREGRAETADERLQLLGRDHANRGVVHVRPRQRVTERDLAV